jgi:DNA-binding beta-propeller fold protein YncE
MLVCITYSMPDTTQHSTLGVELQLFSSPAGVAVYSAGNIVVADLGNHRVLVFGPDRRQGVWPRTVLVPSWHGGGLGGQHRRDRHLQSLSAGVWPRRVVHPRNRLAGF